VDPRHWLLTTLFHLSARPYAALHPQRRPWGLTAAQLADFPPATLGHALGHHLLANGFELMPRLESHDVWHLLTGIGTDVVSEVALQFLLLGNGKRSLYLLGVVALGGLLFPEAWARFARACRRGQALRPFHRLPVHSLLTVPMARVRQLLQPQGVELGPERGLDGTAEDRQRRRGEALPHRVHQPLLHRHRGGRGAKVAADVA